MKDDSIDGIYDTLKQTAKISQSAGGIGLVNSQCKSNRFLHSWYKRNFKRNCSNVDVYYNDTARYVDQGGGKRKGSFAIYLETWHADIFEFLDLKKNTGKEEMRARDLFFAMWTSDLFMKRVARRHYLDVNVSKRMSWISMTFMAMSLKRLYTSYEAQGKGRKTIKARELMGKNTRISN